MTIIHGDVTKIFEVLKKGYSEPIVQSTKGYSLNTGAIAPGTYTYDVPNVTVGNVGYIKKISVTCNDATSLHYVNATRIGAAGAVWLFFLSYFFIGDEWNTGDFVVGPTDILRIRIDNNSGGNVTFSINVYWIESPII